MSKYVIGIDLGTTNSALAFAEPPADPRDQALPRQAGEHTALLHFGPPESMHEFSRLDGLKTARLEVSKNLHFQRTE